MRELGQAPELLYEPSACNIALAKREADPWLAGYDNGGLDYPTLDRLARTMPPPPDDKYWVRSPVNKPDRTPRRTSAEELHEALANAESPGERVAALRIYHGMTYRTLQQRCGMSWSGVYGIEHGTIEPRPWRMERFARVFNVPMAVLMEGMKLPEDYTANVAARRGERAA